MLLFSNFGKKKKKGMEKRVVDQKTTKERRMRSPNRRIATATRTSTNILFVTIVVLLLVLFSYYDHVVHMQDERDAHEQEQGKENDNNVAKRQQDVRKAKSDVVEKKTSGQGSNVFAGIAAWQIDPNIEIYFEPYIHVNRLKLILVVNVASHCGFTKLNYDKLPLLHKHYRGRGFTVFAFPCNQFGNQEADSPAEIKRFVAEHKHADFPLFDKINVNGDDTHPLYRNLKEQAHVAQIEWNFGKFLVEAETGRVLRYFRHDESFELIEKSIEEYLEKR